MASKIPSLIVTCIFGGALLTGCYRDDTKYFADAEDPGLAIFSDKSNNLMSCFVDGKGWRTTSRTTSFISRTRYEVDIIKNITNSPLDTLIITWSGYFTGDRGLTGSISVVLPVAKNFKVTDLSAFQGQRLSLNTRNGFFNTGISGLNLTNTNGTGNIYFHKGRFDSVGPGAYSGTLSGLFEADFGSFKIVRGRFDHNVTPDQVNF